MNVHVLALETSMKCKTIFSPPDHILNMYKFFAWSGMNVKLKTYSLSASFTIDFNTTWIPGYSTEIMEKNIITGIYCWHLI